ncbi:MAG: hypothetical protein IKS64_02125, partial [Muribaculaceae bacterium]|nr:hypothetical protein [Muribaculaceae bacterium]
MKNPNYTTFVFKAVLRMTFTLALLVLSLPAMAFEETLDNGIETFKYSLSGEVTNMGKLKTTDWGSVVISQRSDLEMQQGSGSIRIEAGQAMAKNQNYKITVNVSFWDGNNRDAAGQIGPEGSLGNLILADGGGDHEKRNAKFSESYAIPSKAKYVTIEIYYEAQRSAFRVNAKYTIGGNAPTAKKVPEAQSYKGTMTRFGSKMEYSFSGGTVTSKSIKYSGYGECDMNVYANGVVAPGGTVTASCKKLVGMNAYNEVKVEIYATTSDGNTTILQEKKGGASTTVSAKEPSNAKTLGMKMTYKGRMGDFYCLVNWDVLKEYSASSSNSFKWDDVGVGDRCSQCNGQFSNYYVNNFIGEVSIICNSGQKTRQLDSYYGRLEPIHYNDYFITDGGGDFLILDTNDEYEVLKIMESSKVLLQKRLPNGSDRWVVYKGKIVGKGLKHAAEPSFQMSTCTVTPTGTTYVLEDDGKTSKVFLLEGSMEVTSNKTSQKQTLKPGQTATVSSNGQINVGNFDVGATAKQYG